jgi:hypothetical protein
MTDKFVKTRMLPLGQPPSRRVARARRPAAFPLPTLTFAAVLSILPAPLLFSAGQARAQQAPAFQAAALETAQPLPDAPQPQSAEPASKPKPPDPCPAKPAATVPAPGASTNPPPDNSQQPCKPAQIPLINWFARFLNGPQVRALTPREKAILAARNVIDPFNGITILGSSAIQVGSDSHSPYGPGMAGFGRSVGVSYTQDITGEFFGTFAIPSIVHQDPHYHRLPSATIPRRIGHAVLQVVWTQGDTGKGMLNYANLVGFAIDDEISNLYVPGRETNIEASASRYGIAFALAPTDNFITEFLPDVARRIHVRVVLIQRIINQVARTDATGQ